MHDACNILYLPEKVNGDNNIEFLSYISLLKNMYSTESRTEMYNI